MTQLSLPIAGPPSLSAADLIEDTSNHAALAWLRHPDRWPSGRLALYGPAGTGKTHMLATLGWPQWTRAGRHGLPDLPAAPGIAVDDADPPKPETALLHLLNLCAERGIRIVLAARTAPARWTVALPDLRSRLAAITAVAVLPPSDELLAALLRKHLADRQWRLPPGLDAWLLARLPRDAGAIAEAVARLDAAALSGARLTRAAAAAALADLPGFGAGAEPPGLL